MIYKDKAIMLALETAEGLDKGDVANLSRNQHGVPFCALRTFCVNKR